MTTRRNFLKSAAGIVFCSCGMLDTVHAQAGGRRLPVKVKGKRIKTIDVHSHCLFHESLALMGDEASNVIPKTKGAQEHFIANAIENRLKGMDAMTIDMEVLSINPSWYRKPVRHRCADGADQQRGNGELCATHGRIASRLLRALICSAPDMAVRTRARDDEARAEGCCDRRQRAGRGFFRAKFHPVWAKAEELGAVLFIHPQSTPPLAARFKGNGWLANTIGNPLDTTIALQHLIFEGTLDKFPG